MAKVTVSLPGLSPHHARDLVNMALYDWRRARAGNYVEKRYAHMTEAFRQRRIERLAHELAALDKCEIDAVKEPVPHVPRCACCGTTENLHRDLGSGGPYRCNSADCMVF